MKPLSSYFPIASAAMERPSTSTDPRRNIHRSARQHPPIREATSYGYCRGPVDVRALPCPLAGVCGALVRGAVLQRLSWYHRTALASHIVIPSGLSTLHSAMAVARCRIRSSTSFVMRTTPVSCRHPCIRHSATTLNRARTSRCRSCPPCFFPTLDALDEAFASASAAGHPPKVLLLTNPTNPLGTVWPANATCGAIEWTMTGHGLHVVSDEIYAASVFGDD